jgi:hypothetical protein
MKKSLRDRLIHIIEISEGQTEENILTILKTVIQEYEGTEVLTRRQIAVRESNKTNGWGKR